MWGDKHKHRSQHGVAGPSVVARVSDVATLIDRVRSEKARREKEQAEFLRKKGEQLAAELRLDVERAMAEERQNALIARIQKLRRQGRTLQEVATACKVSVNYVSKHVPAFIQQGSKRGPYNVQSRHKITWPFARSSEMDPLLAAVNAVVPKGLREEVRQDICQNLCVAVLSGEASIDHLKDVVESFIRPAMRAANDTSVLSLDYPIKSGSGSPLKELV